MATTAWLSRRHAARSSGRSRKTKALKRLCGSAWLRPLRGPGAAPNAFVMVRARGAEPVRRDIVVGQVGPMGVEVLSGLKAGDVVVWTPPPQSLQP